jgi:exopolysaccharide biosynthesis polyprenyl glycosylphosphotransferase
MVSEREAFIRYIMKGIDLLMILLAFPIAYFLDEFIRLFVNVGEKAYALEPTLAGFLFFAHKNLPMIIGFPLIWLALLGLHGIYRDFRTKSFVGFAGTIFAAAVWATITSAGMIFVLKMVLTSRLFFITFSATAYALLVLEKRILIWILYTIHERGYHQVNLLIVGTGKRAQEFIRVVKSHKDWGLNVIGLIDDEHGLFGKEVEGFRVLGRIQDIPFIISRIVIDRVIFVVPRLWLHRIEEAILACEKLGVPTAISLDLYDLRIARARQADFNGFPLLEFETFAAKEWQLFIKRSMDIMIGLFALFLFSPIMLLSAILIKLNSHGPVFFMQTRIGLKGRKFTLYKFRSMVTGAEKIRRTLLEQNEMDGPVFKIRKDPRITSIGRVLRRTSIDELPQLLNVLKGDMSIVGPRPPLPVEVEMYEAWQRRRLSLKPGITCVWQVSGRNKISFERWMEMDLEYIDKWSLILDIKILIKTLFVVFTGYGAR